MARNEIRPIRPNPLIPTRTATAVPLSFVYLDVFVCCCTAEKLSAGAVFSSADFWHTKTRRKPDASLWPGENPTNSTGRANSRGAKFQQVLWPEVYRRGLCHSSNRSGGPPHIKRPVFVALRDGLLIFSKSSVLGPAQAYSSTDLIGRENPHNRTCRVH